MIKLAFTEWLFVLRAKKIVIKNIQPILKHDLAQEQIKKNPIFYFLLETESKN